MSTINVGEYVAQEMNRRQLIVQPEMQAAIDTLKRTSIHVLVPPKQPEIYIEWIRTDDSGQEWFGVFRDGRYDGAIGAEKTAEKAREKAKGLRAALTKALASREYF